jgi:hypothetical protein
MNTLSPCVCIWLSHARCCCYFGGGVQQLATRTARHAQQLSTILKFLNSEILLTISFQIHIQLQITKLPSSFRFRPSCRRAVVPSSSPLPLLPLLPLPMDFTDLYRHTHAQASFSPGRHFILTAINDRIVVRKSSTFTITASFQADLTPSTTSSVLAGKPSAKLFAAEASITQCTWSPDSEYILAACPRRGIVNIFALRDTTWNARIEAGVEGLVRAEWAPDSRHIFCFSQFGVRTQVLDR